MHLLNMYARTGHSERAEQSLQAMQKRDIAPSQYHFEAALRACIRGRDSDAGLRILGLMRGCGFTAPLELAVKFDRHLHDEQYESDATFDRNRAMLQNMRKFEKGLGTTYNLREKVRALRQEAWSSTELLPAPKTPYLTP